MKRIEAYNSYEIIKNICSGSLSVETMLKYIELRRDLVNFIEEFDKIKIETSNQTKPKDWKEGDPHEEWDKAFVAIINEWLNKDIDIDTHIFTKEEIAKLAIANPDLTGNKLDFLIKMFTID